MVELLAPAGSLEALRAAVNAGADAVYIGGQSFGARAYADNPDISGLIEGIEYCHLRGKKLYLTVNTLLKENELEKKLVNFLDPLVEHGVDALLIQDLGALRFLTSHYPSLPLHASTQMSVTTAEGASLLKRHGVSRVVTARELSLQELQPIIQTGVEVETFVHGALCYCYSGRCLFSSMIGGRSGNRGRCAQPCRQLYDGKFPLSMKDLCTLDLLPELVDAGIASFKIEGRMKQSKYTAGVTAIYRKYLNLYQEKGREGYHVSEEDRQILTDLFNRCGFTEGYYHTYNSRDMVEVDRKIASPRKKENKQADALSAKYTEGNSKVKINGELRIYPDEPAILNVWLCGYKRDSVFSVSAEGEIPFSAKNAALSVESISRQIEKTGDTSFEFESLNIDLKEGLFMPLSKINDLRRRALDLLKNRILEERNKGVKASAVKENQYESFKERMPNDKRSLSWHPVWTILVTFPDQLQTVLKFLQDQKGRGTSVQVGTVYMDSMLLGTAEELDDRCKMLSEAVAEFHKIGIQCFFVFPPVLRDFGRKVLDKCALADLLRKMDGYMISSIDELEYLKGSSFSGEFAAEDCLYSFNIEARALLEEEGVTRFTFPAELNAGELTDLNPENSELIVYGYQALMQSAQCVKKTVHGCNGKPEIVRIKDRINVLFPVLNRCLFCTNTIYNSVPLSLGGCRDEIERIAPSFLRLSFTIETSSEVRGILESYLRGNNAEVFEGTRGHFKRGVQ